MIIKHKWNLSKLFKVVSRYSINLGRYTISWNKSMENQEGLNY